MHSKKKKISVGGRVCRREEGVDAKQSCVWAKGTGGIECIRLVGESRRKEIMEERS